MAEEKKSFLLYCDLIHTVEKMTDEKAGLLLKHLLKYVNDLNPSTEDMLIELVFEPIKQQLKRDLEKWNKEKTKKSNAGIMGNLKRWHPDLFSDVELNNISLEKALSIAENRRTSQCDNRQSHPIAEIAVIDTVTVSVTDNDKVTKKVNNIKDRKLKFASTLESYLELYGRDMLNDFYSYWTEENKSGTKFKQEIEKTWSLDRRLKTWSENDRNFKKEKIPEQKEKIEKIIGRQDLNTVQQNILKFYNNGE